MTDFVAMLAPLGVSTGDGRRFAENGITLAPTPFPLEWARSREEGHDGAVVVGVVNRATVATVDDAVDAGYVSRERARGCGLPGGSLAVWGRGELFDTAADPERMPRLSEDVSEVMILIEKGTLGPSVDLDSFECSFVHEGTDIGIDWDCVTEETRVEMLVTSGRVRAATLVSIPAFQETSWPIELLPRESLAASVTGATDLPVADPGTEWDGAAAATRVFEHYTDGNEVDTAGVARAFLYRDPDADPATKGAYKLGYADVVDGELAVVPRGVSAVAGGRGVDATTGIPDTEKARIRERVCALYDRIRSEHEDWPECPFADAAESSAAALTASVSLPPADAFGPPALTGPTPITYDWETGRVYGHIAAWRTCHTGIADVCVTPPHDNGDYAWFNRHPVETGDGVVWAGRLTMGGRHPSLGLTASGAMAAYDAKTTVAYVCASEDDHGIVVAGVLADGLSEDTREILSRRTVSGDWRETAGGLSLVEVLALSPGLGGDSEPGFPVGSYSRHGRQVALTAAYGARPGGAGGGVTSGDGADRESGEAFSWESLRAVLREERQREQALRGLMETLAEESGGGY